MILQLKEDLEKYVDDQVRAGHFPSREAVVEAALVQSMTGDVALTEEDLKEIALADAEIARGETRDFDQFAVDVRKRFSRG